MRRDGGRHALEAAASVVVGALVGGLVNVFTSAPRRSWSLVAFAGVSVLAWAALEAWRTTRIRTNVRRNVGGPVVELPEGPVIARPEKTDEIVGKLLAKSGRKAGPIVAVVGAGGFGKTTLAWMAGQHGRVARRYGNPITASLGQGTTGAALAAKINDVVEVLRAQVHQVRPRIERRHRIEAFDEPVLRQVEVHDRPDRLQVIGMRRNQGAEMPQADVLPNIAQHKLLERASVDAEADQAGVLPPTVAGLVAHTCPLNATAWIAGSASNTSRRHSSATWLTTSRYSSPVFLGGRGSSRCSSFVWMNWTPRIGRRPSSGSSFLDRRWFRGPFRLAFLLPAPPLPLGGAAPARTWHRSSPRTLRPPDAP